MTLMISLKHDYKHVHCGDLHVLLNTHTQVRVSMIIGATLCECVLLIDAISLFFILLFATLLILIIAVWFFGESRN